MNVRIIFCSFLALGLSGCAFEPPRPPKTVFEIREIQTRTFEDRNSKAVQKAILNVLQDDDYVVRNAESDLGLISATKEQAVEGRGRDFNFGTIIGFPHLQLGSRSDNSIWPASEVFEATVNVTQFGKKTKVRINVQRRVVNNRGATVESEIIDDPVFYQAFFSKVSKGLYIQREKL